MSTDLDLDAIRARHNMLRHAHQPDDYPNQDMIAALLAEVERLRGLIEEYNALD